MEGLLLPEERPSFLTLPPEIRDVIYFWLSVPDRHDPDPITGIRSLTFHLNVLRTCKKVYMEARRIFRLENVFVRIETPWPQAERHVETEGRVNILASGDDADRFGLFQQLRVIITSPEMDAPTTARFIIYIDDLEAFCKMWFYSDLGYIGLNSHLHLTLLLSNPTQEKPLPRAIQRRLVEPFGVIKGLHKMEMEGQYDADLKEALQKEMAVPYDTPSTCLAKCDKLKDLGNAELKAGNYSKALNIYSQAFEAIHIVIDGRRRHVYADPFFEVTLTEEPFRDQYGGLVRTVMRIRLVANTMMAYLLLEEWDEALYWGMRSIGLMRRMLGDGADQPREPFPASKEWGKVYYRTAVAAEELGHAEQAREFYRIAQDWLPRDEKIREAVARTALRLG